MFARTSRASASQLLFCMERNGKTELMSRRIRHILLVCNNYDNFALEEDGRIDVRIAQEYLELNLSNPPRITRAETPEQALQMVRDGHSFDLVITMYNSGNTDVVAFAKTIKELIPGTPVVLLTNFSREIYTKVMRQLAAFASRSEAAPIDYYFCWNSSSDLIIAIIKLLEDRMNADHDIHEEGVRAILLVEDSVRYYSTYLPVLYRLIFQQNAMAIRDALNEQQQLMRKRARPKVLLATCLDEAKQLYAEYKENIIGVISDIGFVVHKGDAPETEQQDAGVELCRLIRRDNPTMPFVLQSSQGEMRHTAEKLHVGFIRKKSKTLTQELSDFISNEFGFGDFIVRHHKTGAEIARASNMRQLEELITQLPARDFRRLSDNNKLSKWLYARGLFDLGRLVEPLIISDENDVEQVREQNIRFIHDYRIHQAQGVVAHFDPATWNDTILFSRVGSSSLGGKARGLAFLNHILNKYNLYDRWEDVRVTVPRTMVITTEYFDRFIHDNGLQDVINSDLSDEEILQEFVTSGLPDDLIEALRCFVSVTDCPLAIRSSSKLEDSYYQPFAGVYATYMIPHTDNPEQQLRLLKKALKSVYASVYLASARGYITSTGNMISEEKMAIVLQEVCGSEQQGLWFPTFSGVARSINFYPVGNEKPEEGIVKVAYGLGKTVVDGDPVLRFSPRYPRHVIQTSTPDLALRETQKQMYALDLQPDRFRTSINDAVNLLHLDIADCNRFPSLHHVASTFDYANQRIVDSCFPDGPRIVSFAPILKFDTFPLASILRHLLDVAAAEMKTPVEIEFACNMDSEPMQFSVLQIRPISADSLNAKVDWDTIDQSRPLLLSDSALGVGRIEDVRDIIYLRRDAFDVLHTREMADTLREWNNRMRTESRGYLLLGYGRWGSAIPTLGVPVIWSDISEARAIAECCLPDFRIDPSQGSHFFQNLTSFNVGYMHIDPYGRPDDCFDEEALNALPALEETPYIRHVRLDEPITLCIDGFRSHAFAALPSPPPPK